jgi:catechol 2,3-dioxygenase-like lactoylglutathione lyase family enzyme
VDSVRDAEAAGSNPASPTSPISQMVMPTVRYLVRNVDAAVRFYTAHLGFELERRIGLPFAIVRRGDLHLWLSGPESSAARPMPDGRRPEPGGWNRLVIEVVDIQATVQQLTQAGVPFRNQIVSGPGGKQILLEDPSGNPIELFQPAT